MPERAHIVGGFRTFNNDVRALLRQRIPELAEGIAKANRCTAVCTQTPGYDATINDEAMALEVSRTLENIVGEGNVILTNKPFMGSGPRWTLPAIGRTSSLPPAVLDPPMTI